MPLARILLLTVAWVLSAPAARAAQPVSLEAWFVDSLTKIFPTDRPEAHRLILPELWAARDQHVSLQLAIRSSRPLATVTAEASPLRETNGQTISGVTIQPVGYVVVGSHTPETPHDELVGEAPGWYPDPLLAFPLDLEARRTYPIWISVHVPRDAQPGLYRGLVVVRSGPRVLAQAAFRLRVLAASVPPERTLKVTNWFSLDDKLSRQFYGVAAFSPEWWTLVENVARVMAEHRQNVILTPLMELVQPRAEAGSIRYDFENFDRWVETFRKAGAIGFIEGSHLLGRAGSYEAPLQVPTFQLAGDRVEQKALPPDDPRVESFLAGFLSALNAHLEEKGLKPIYFQHILDEAHGAELPYYAKFGGIVRRYLTGVQTLDAVDAAHMPEELQENCDVWVPQLGRFDDQMKLIDQRCQTGHEVWFYTCLYPRHRYLNRLMDYPLLKVRLLHWLNFRYNLTGFLHWGGNYWTPEPMLDTQPVIDNNTELLPSGDAFILYPDRPNKSVRSSIRLEVMREGIEDYEMLHALRQKNAAEAERIAEAAVSSFTVYVREPAAFRKIERTVLKALSIAQPAAAGAKPEAKSSSAAGRFGGRS